MNHLNTEIYKTLMEELKKIKINGNIFHTHELEKLILSKYPDNLMKHRASM